jgi:glycosyltransferase involved in cell wall biosynthesis
MPPGGALIRRSILFFVEGKTLPAPRFRALQYIPYLERMGWECRCLSLFQGRPSSLFYRKGLGLPYKLLVRSRRFGQAAQARHYGLAFIQRLAWPFSCWPERLVGYFNNRLVFDFDDAIYQSEEGEGSGLRRRAFSGMVSRAQAVLAGSAYLASQTGAPEKTFVFPTVVDTEHYLPRGGPWGKVIGWMGTAGNYGNFEPLLPELRVLLATGRFTLRLVSDRPPPFSLPNMEFRPWSLENELADLRTFDLGIMPLTDSSWNRGKCAFKLIQYMAVGVPVLASAVGANVEVVGGSGAGHLVGAGQWAEAIEALLADPLAAAAMGARGRVHCETHYSIASQLGRLNGILEAVAGLSAQGSGSKS